MFSYLLYSNVVDQIYKHLFVKLEEKSCLLEVGRNSFTRFYPVSSTQTDRQTHTERELRLIFINNNLKSGGKKIIIRNNILIEFFLPAVIGLVFEVWMKETLTRDPEESLVS